MKKKTKRNIKFLIIALLCIVAISGCQPVSGQASGSPESSTQEDINMLESAPNSVTVRLELVKDDSPFHCVYRDVVTGVLYLESADGGITAMLDPETGLPLTYEDYLEMSNAEPES